MATDRRISQPMDLHGNRTRVGGCCYHLFFFFFDEKTKAKGEGEVEVIHKICGLLGISISVLREGKGR